MCHILGPHRKAIYNREIIMEKTIFLHDYVKDYCRKGLVKYILRNENLFYYFNSLQCTSQFYRIQK